MVIVECNSFVKGISEYDRIAGTYTHKMVCEGFFSHNVLIILCTSILVNCVFVVQIH